METDAETLRPWLEKVSANPRNVPAVIELTRRYLALDRVGDVLALSARYAGEDWRLAEHVLRVAKKTKPRDIALAEAFCHLAEQRGDSMEATMRWTNLRRRFPFQNEAHLGYIDAMLRQHRSAEAEIAASAAQEFLGKRLPVFEVQARIAEAQGRFSDAAEIWAEIAATTPSHPLAASRLAAAEQAAQAGGIDAGLPPGPKIPSSGDMDPAELKKLVMAFESLGHNCELGLLQRQFGAEPLGLLRFSFTLLPTVEKLLRTRFAGIAEAESMTVSDVGYEYLLTHSDSSWTMHTRIQPRPEDDLNKVLHDQLRHTGFLRRKLLRDLEQQNKIFVYWRHDLDDAAILRIYEAVNAYGPNTVLCVRLCDKTHPPGSFEWRNDRLMVAALDRPGNAFRGAGWKISADYWVYFLREAHARWSATRPAAAPAAA